MRIFSGKDTKTAKLKREPLNYYQKASNLKSGIFNV